MRFWAVTWNLRALLETRSCDLVLHERRKEAAQRCWFNMCLVQMSRAQWSQVSKGRFALRMRTLQNRKGKLLAPHIGCISKKITIVLLCCHGTWLGTRRVGFGMLWQACTNSWKNCDVHDAGKIAILLTAKSRRRRKKNVRAANQVLPGNTEKAFLIIAMEKIIELVLNIELVCLNLRDYTVGLHSEPKQKISRPLVVTSTPVLVNIQAHQSACMNATS